MFRDLFRELVARANLKLNPTAVIKENNAEFGNE